jgi:hypothetical protein
MGDKFLGEGVGYFGHGDHRSRPKIQKLRKRTFNRDSNLKGSKNFGAKSNCEAALEG